MTIQLLHGDCRDILPTLPPASVQCVVTSPPYFGLRRYDVEGAQIGMEQTPAAYVAALVEVFRGVRRVLRDDGVLWVNLGDSYSGGGGYYPDAPSNQNGRSMQAKGNALGVRNIKGGRVVSDLRDCLQASIEGRVLALRGSYTLTITAQRGDVFDTNHVAPDSELAPLFGVKRIFIKQGNDNLCQVLDLLDSESRLWIGRSVRFARVGQAQADIILDASDHIRIVVSEHDLDCQSALGITALTNPTENGQVSLAIEKPAEPIAEGIGYVQSNRDAVTLDTPRESLLEIDFVNDLVAAGQRLAATAEGLRDFSVTKASEQHFALTMLEGRFDLAVNCVGHLLASNEYGSLIRYTELYDKAERLSNSLKPKQLIGIPWMVARALQEDGWILRQDCIWAKPNPMPESVTDRPTRAHEYLFLFAKQARYFYDAAAIAEAAMHTGGGTIPTPDKAAAVGQTSNGTGATTLRSKDSPTRNRRTVWTVSTRPFSGAHFAVFPEQLIEPCILAGSAAQACEHCGAPWERVVESVGDNTANEVIADYDVPGLAKGTSADRVRRLDGKNYQHVRRATGGFRPTCACPGNTGAARSVVLDPFVGSGTTCRVAERFGRNSIGIDLGYQDLQEQRTNGVQKVMVDLL